MWSAIDFFVNRAMQDMTRTVRMCQRVITAGYGLKTAILFFLMPLAALALGTTDSIQKKGVVTDLSGLPVPGAAVRMEKTSCTALTDGDGSFDIRCIPAATRVARPQPDGFSIALRDKSFSIYLPSSQQVRIDCFDMRGRYTGTLVDGMLRAGQSTIAASLPIARQMQILRCRVGRSTIQVKNIIGLHCFQTSPGLRETAATRCISAAIAAPESVIGTMTIAHPLYATQKIAINPHVDTVLSITLVAAQARWVFSLDKQCADDDAHIAAMHCGNCFVLGTTHSPAGDYDMGIIILDSSGFVTSRHRYGDAESEVAYKFGISAADDIRIFGTYGMMPPTSMFFSTHVSRSGELLGTHIVTSDTGLTLDGGAVAGDGGYVLAGYSHGVDSISGHNISDAIVFRFSGSDELIWRKRYTIEYYTISLDIIALEQGGFILAGSYYDTLARDSKVFLNKLDENGNSLKHLIFSGLQTAQYRQTIEMADHKILFLGQTTCGARECPYLAWLSADLSIVHDSVITDPTIQIPCMAQLPDNTVVLACRAIPVKGSDTDFEFERIKLINIDSGGRQLREKIVSEECGHPLSVSAGKDGSVVISSAAGYTFLKQKFYIVNVSW